MIKTRLNKGSLYIVSAPSGTGKTTILKELLNNISGIKESVSYTTRKPRNGEINDISYTFINTDEFMEMMKKEEFIEWAKVHGNFYGTSIKRIENILNEGYDVILDIDTQGALQLKTKFNNACYIFILPPSMDALKERLLKRGGVIDDTALQRLENAKKEIEMADQYDYIIINDNLLNAVKEVETIVISNRLRKDTINPQWIKTNFLQD
ncbi:guanylate kinase [Candidatus Magnetoovum chiemensis]|nr:guanylate kinase [Candidatus Magnetoovum chiemensis]